MYLDTILLVSDEGDNSGIFSVNGDCDYLYGCTDELAFNYNPDAIVENSSCTYPVMGCTDPVALNYNPDAEEDDGSCYYVGDVLGCTDEVALNYDVNATYDDGSCQYPSLSLDPVSTELCLGESVLISWTGGNPSVAINIGLINVTTNTSIGSIDIVDNTGEYIWVIEDVIAGTGVVYKFYIQDHPWPPTSWSYGSDFIILDNCNEIVYGCTDSIACNYDPTASEDDGSCLYTIDAIGICGGDCSSDSNNDGICDPFCPEDLNSDGYITIQDLLLILSEFGCTSSCVNDITQDGNVAVDDLLQILSEFGNTCE